MKRYSPLIVLLILIGVLAVSQVATAASSPPPAPSFAHQNLSADDAEEPEDEFEAEGGEFEFEECEADDAEEFEFDEEDEEFEEEEFDSSCGDEGANDGKADPKGSVTAPAACQVRQAESTVTTLPGSDQVRISVNYRTYSPTQVAVGVKLKDGKGSLAIEHATKHLGDKGVLHLSARLGAAAMDRALDAKEFDVSLRAPETPAFCAGALEQRLQRAQAARVYSG